MLLLIMGSELLMPNIAYALTSGPSQPETQAFQPIGNSNMVDLFSGDFSYNIPLLDVGGYPVNLAYQSGANMDDESSWAGYGWNINVGSLNRQLRGLPDDFNGTDWQEREMNMKDHITKGGRFSMTLDLLGVPKSNIKFKKKKKKKLDLALTVSVGVKVDNYRGIGMEVGVNPGVSLTDYAAGANTKGADGLYSLDSVSSSSLPLGGGLTLSSQDGATVNLNAAILRKTLNKGESNLSRSVGFAYNTRAGLQGMTMSGSFDRYKLDAADQKIKRAYGREFNSYLSFNGNTYTPTIDHATHNESYSFSLHLGPELWVALAGLGVTGFYSKQKVAQRKRISQAFGYLNSERGKDIPEALLDFNREKDVPFHSQVKYLPIPVPTYDLFSATSQDGAGQYRIYRGSSGVFFDQRTENTSNDFSLGIEGGAGAYFDVGADVYNQSIETISQKWRSRNTFLSKGDFQGAAMSEPLYEPAYFKRVGEPVPFDNDYVSSLKGVSPVAVSLPSRISNATEGAEASDKLRTKATPQGEVIPVLKRQKREVRNTTFNYLTAKEAGFHALDKTLKDLHPDSLVLNNCNTGGIRNSFNRYSSYRKGHHFSEITVTGDDGKRSVYGLPVYNISQEEVSFSVTGNPALRNRGLIPYVNGSDNSVNNTKGRENYYSKEKTPAYASSYLLTAILSPDYVDRTGDGITDDDLGSAVKFNYSKLPSIYKWRTPFAFGQDTANYNEGLLSDDKDDKASYAYGEKEIWYLHSIESKTMVAHFITEDRKDAFGVLNSRGGVDTTIKMKRLKEIRLYSKSDLRINGNDPSKTIPVKVVHLEHDYSLYRGLPNSLDKGGKLTLKRVYFTFGQNQKGRLNPYDFEYDTTYNTYGYRQYDRWGNFKEAAQNPGGLNNAEYPYALQSSVSDDFASAGQLKKIILPSGGSIAVHYEADDYAYVQDRRASVMCRLNGISTQGTSTGLVNADYVLVDLPYPVANNQELRERYFEGVQNLYFKCLLDLDALGHKEFVPGYAEIDPFVKPELVSASIAKIKLKKVDGVNAITRSGWQFIRSNLPKYAYPGSDNLDDNGSNIAKIIKALVTAFGSIKELVYGFEKRARDKKFSDKLVLAQSWVRLCAPEWKKKGGGSRVKRIDISDDWAAMSGAAGAQTAMYSQVFDYTTKDGKGRSVSSGVASYEPLIGNDENPFRQPIRYKQSQFLALDNFYYIEEPFGESFFPAANVGYSKVTVRTIGAGDAESVNRTGTSVSEFYTARDYPTKVDVLGMEHRKPIASKVFKLIGGVSYDMLGVSQGYSIELNDMHGKPRTVNVYNKAGQNISSVEYFYQTVNPHAEKKELRNDVKVIYRDGTVKDGVIGTDVELFNDMRQETVNNLGVSMKISGGSGAVFIFPLPFFFPGVGVNYDRRSFRSSSSIKIVNRFAIQTKVTRVENGSSITSENLAWDAETGNILLTKTQNEFDDPVYSFAYPAHWAYDGMAQGYRNLGTVLTGLSTGANGQILNSVYDALLVPGDEIVNMDGTGKYWVASTPVSSVTQKRLIDKDGNIALLMNIKARVLRSGRRNMANTAIATIASLRNPIASDKLNISSFIKVLDAKASIFEEEWSVPFYCLDCPQGFTKSEDGSYCYKDTAATYNPPSYMVCEGNVEGHYTSCGTYFYDSYSSYGSVFVRHRIARNNLFWNGDTTKCTQTPPGSAESGSQMSNLMAVQDTGTLAMKKADQTTMSALVENDSCTNQKPTWGTGPLNRCGIWTYPYTAGSGISRQPLNRFIGFSRTINVPATKTYLMGIAADNDFNVSIDGSLLIQQTGSNEMNFRIWHVYPIQLTAGQHIIEMSGLNTSASAAFGVELYDNTETELASVTSYSDTTLNLVFSTKDMIGQQFDVGVYTCPAGYALNTADTPYTCRQILNADKVINPYNTGMKGNWRPKSQSAYQVNRETPVSDPGRFGSTDIRRSGAYSVFNPFWVYDNSSLKWIRNTTQDNRWIAANEITYINTKGVELENKDALGRYSSALFGYLESLPVAVASNTRYRELAYDGMEDYSFSVDCVSGCDKSHFDFRQLLNGGTIDTTSAYAHSGKYSLKLGGNVSLSKTVYTGPPSSLYSFDNNGRYLFADNELGKGFSPIPGKKYVISFWVKDNSPRSANSTMQVNINGNTLMNSSLKWPVVEGWKRIELPFMLDVSAGLFSIQLQSGGGTVYLDDIRIHPYEGQMKSYAYDASTQRLMAELDENNFASFYEYDDEGTLIRMKKETERGIMTIKESRSGYRKRQ
ncbi:MAG: hypothetical protein ACTHMV_10325 [Chitinophagaceae bacterium]